MTFLYKPICQDDFVANIEEVQNSGDIVTLFCSDFKNSVIQGFGVGLTKSIPFLFQ